MIERMKIKRFQAKNMREAMRQVRDEQGPDAVILSNRRIPGGVEVVAAVDYDAALVQQTVRRAPVTSATQAAAAAPVAAAARTAAAAVSQPEVEAVAEPAVARVAPAAAAVAAALAAAEAPAAPAPAPAAPAPSINVLQQDLNAVRRLLEEQLASMMWGDMQRRRPLQAGALRTLVDLGLDTELARQIAEQLPDSADADRARFLPLGLLGRRIPVATDDIVLQGGIIALVGPTGIGKTTTVAKLAAHFGTRYGVRDIALVTTDHYRIGAAEQLYTYGRLLGVPVHAVGAHEDLGSVLARLSDRRLVLIDSAGLGQRDKALSGQIDKLRALGPQLKTLLVMAANTRPASMEDTVRRFSALPLSGCILTKIDEADRLGGALSVAIRNALPVAYYTDGQRVPEDIHLARADRLVLRATQLARQLPAPVDEHSIAVGFNKVAHVNA
jgi:flagellar biosynthesis protein FlhF